jgi:hypothetical protein
MTAFSGARSDGILRCSVDLINVGIAFSRAIAELPEVEDKRAVVEILSPALNEYDLQKVYGFAQSTKAKLEKIGFTSLFLVEKEMHDSVSLSTLLQPFDGVIDIGTRPRRGQDSEKGRRALHEGYQRRFELRTSGRQRFRDSGRCEGGRAGEGS